VKRLLDRPSKVNEIHEVNRELEKIYDILNTIRLSVNTYDDSKTHKGKSGDIRISKNKSGEVVLEIFADDGWYTSTEIFSKMKSGE
tara:strand:+ start:47 stop:304 length:258 start_codon:yes stop_codon:yes gene_type:complete